jgi:L-seryl-tRNA(Ser) seleniumtransferase
MSQRLENAATQAEIPRRDMLVGGAAVVGGLIHSTAAQPAAFASSDRPSVYERLGVKHVINAAGTLTVLGGSLMPPEVAAAWHEASLHFVDLVDLQIKVGERIAQLIGVEAALVTTGAAGAMQLATAAALTRDDRSRVRQLPDTTGLKNEVIVQKTHRTCYDNQITACGAKLIEVETSADLERAITDRTVLMLFYNLHDSDGQIDRAAWLATAKRRGILTLLDAAADVPPVRALSQYNEMGFDMVAFSGGKALRGPNDTGMLLGKKDLIEAARANTNPTCGCIGRALKVGKEDMVALLAAVERYMQNDHDAEWREWERRLGVIEHALADVPTVTTERIVPPIANHVPHLLVYWDESKVKISREQVTKELAQADPPIALGRVRGTGEHGLLVSVFVLQPGEVEVVARRLVDVLRAAAR